MNERRESLQSLLFTSRLCSFTSLTTFAFTHRPRQDSLVFCLFHLLFRNATLLILVSEGVLHYYYRATSSESTLSGHLSPFSLGATAVQVASVTLEAIHSPAGGFLP